MLPKQSINNQLTVQSANNVLGRPWLYITRGEALEAVSELESAGIQLEHPIVISTLEPKDLNAFWRLCSPYELRELWLVRSESGGRVCVGGAWRALHAATETWWPMRWWRKRSLQRILSSSPPESIWLDLS